MLLGFLKNVWVENRVLGLLMARASGKTARSGVKHGPAQALARIWQTPIEPADWGESQKLGEPVGQD